MTDARSAAIITNDQVEIAAEAAWANYMKLDRRDEFESDEEWSSLQNERKQWPHTGLYPDADDFRRCVRAGLRALGFEVEEEATRG